MKQVTGANDDPPGGAKTRVLVVDDEPIIVRLVGKCLESLATVVGETDPHQALERLLSEPFDVVVCDVMMPGMTGIDLHERVARERPECAARFVFTTGGTYTARAHDYLERIASENVRLDKPFNSARLVEAVMAVARKPPG